MSRSCKNCRRYQRVGNPQPYLCYSVVREAPRPILRATDRWHGRLRHTATTQRWPSLHSALISADVDHSCGVNHPVFVENTIGNRSRTERRLQRRTTIPMPDSTERTINKHIRVLPQQWERIEQVAQGSALTPNQLVIELAMEALDQRDWPRSEAELRVARASLFAAQVLARDLIAAGRGNEVAEIREFISTIVPDPDSDPHSDDTTSS